MSQDSLLGFFDGHTTRVVRHDLPTTGALHFGMIADGGVPMVARGNTESDA